MLQLKETWDKEGDSRIQVEQLLIDADIDFDELESPIQRANGSHKWLASFNGEPIAEVELTDPKIKGVLK